MHDQQGVILDRLGYPRRVRIGLADVGHDQPTALSGFRPVSAFAVEHLERDRGIRLVRPFIE